LHIALAVVFAGLTRCCHCGISNSTWVSVVLSVVRGHPPRTIGRPGLCVGFDLTPSRKVALEVALQLSVLLVMVLLFAIGKAACPTKLGLTPRKTATSRRGGGTDSYSYYTPMVEVVERGDSSDSKGGSLSQAPSHWNIENDDGAALPVRARLVTAAVNFGLSAYGTLLPAAASMLHCVEVPGRPGSFRFIDARHECSGSYRGFYAVAALLLLVPPALVIAAGWSMGKPGPAWVRKARIPCLFGRASASPQPFFQLPQYRLVQRKIFVEDCKAGVRRALVLVYDSKRWYWEGAIALCRLVSAGFFST
jgi:hypothetical protein